MKLIQQINSQYHPMDLNIQNKREIQTNILIFNEILSFHKKVGLNTANEI